MTDSVGISPIISDNNIVQMETSKISSTTTANKETVSSEAMESIYIKSLSDLRNKNGKMYDEMMKSIAQQIITRFQKSADRLKQIRKAGG